MGVCFPGTPAAHPFEITEKIEKTSARTGWLIGIPPSATGRDADVYSYSMAEDGPLGNVVCDCGVC